MRKTTSHAVLTAHAASADGGVIFMFFALAGRRYINRHRSTKELLGPSACQEWCSRVFRRADRAGAQACRPASGIGPRPSARALVRTRPNAPPPLLCRCRVRSTPEVAFG